MEWTRAELMLLGCAVATVALAVGVVSIMRGATLLRADALLRTRSRSAWIAFRVLAGLLAALGLFAWVGVWFGRSPWLGAMMAINCALVLAHELGLLPAIGRRTH